MKGTSMKLTKKEPWFNVKKSISYMQTARSISSP